MSVGEIAQLSGVSVRTLHRYDEVGLLVPARGVINNFRTYTLSELDRLQVILGYRELGFTLERISEMLNSPENLTQHLAAQEELIIERIEQLSTQLNRLQKTMEAQTMTTELTPGDRFELFGDFDVEGNAREAHGR